MVQIGQDLQSGNLSDAQQVLGSMQQHAQSATGSGFNHHRPPPPGADGVTPSMDLASLLQDGQSTTGDTSSTVTNADGSSTTTITYADGSQVTLSTPAASSSSTQPTGSSTSSPQSTTYNNLLETLIQLQAQQVASSTGVSA